MNKISEIVEKNLRHEGSLVFWIRTEGNPTLKDSESNLNFMLNSDIGGVVFTIFKEKEFLRVAIDNPEYGKTRIAYNIIKYLKEDIMVAITWEKNIVKLYLNGELVVANNE